MGEAAIDLADLEFSWTPGAASLDVPAFTIGRGERVLLSGPSGSGKSTLLGVIGGVLVPQSGTVRLLGTDLAALAPAARDRFRADHVGFIFQMFNLLPYLSVMDNVTLAATFSRQRRERAGDLRAEAWRLLAALGIGQVRVLERPVAQLSIGQQQRVAAARALLGRPELLIADEPTSSLDAADRSSFLELQKPRAPARGSSPSPGAQPIVSTFRQRQKKGDRCSPSNITLNPYLSFVSLYDFMDNGKPKTCT